jgi:uncharacterized membrane protein YjjP (DUF1212 family)
MANTRQKNILRLALLAGEAMLKSGAEVYRVEDTITRICGACGVHRTECFATTTGLFLSIDDGDGSEMHTSIKRIKRISINLGKISKINEFSRRFTSEGMSVEDGLRELRLIDGEKPLNLPLNLLAAAMIGAPLCLSFGGGVIDSALCALVTSAAYLSSLWIGKLQINAFIGIFLSCAVCALLSVALLEAGLASSLSPVIIASITMFLPGVAITNAARDLLSGDMLSGVARFAEALVIAAAIAGGVVIVLKPWSLVRGGFPYDVIIRYPLGLFFIFAFFTTLGFCIQFNVPRRQMAAASFIGAIGFTLFEFSLLHLGHSAVLASFLASCLVAAAAEVASRAGKDAATLFIIPGVIPLVPGTGMYTTMAYVMQNDFDKSTLAATQALFMAGGIAAALVIVASFTRTFMASAARFMAAARRRRPPSRGG